MKRKIIIIALALMLVLLPGIALAQSTIEEAIGSTSGFYVPSQINSFYAAGRYWVFYTVDDGGADEDMYVESSLDGITWGIKTLICTVAADDTGASVFFDGTYVHYTVVRAAVATKIYYRRGTPNADGSITWSSVEQTALAATGSSPYVSVDTNGCPWIGYKDAATFPAVTKSSTTDGTWITDAGFPHQLSAAQSGSCMSILPLTNGRMLALYGAGDPDGIQAQRWDGVAWGAERSTTTVVTGVQLYSAVAQDDDVHLVMVETTTLNTEYEIYDYSTNQFIGKTTIATGGTSSSSPVICRTDLNDLYVFIEDLPDDDKIYYYKYDYYLEEWEAKVELVDETVLDGLPSIDYYLNCDYNPDFDKVGVYYVSDPAKLKYKAVSEDASITTLTPTAITSTAATFRGDITSLGTGAITVRGFQYGLSETPTWTESESGTFGTGVYSLTATELESDTIYYARAYATNSVGTVYGEWIGFLSAQQGSDQPDDPDDGMLPPVPTSAPGGWIIHPDDKTYDTWPGSELINTFADMVSRSFVWFLLTVATIVGIGLLITRYTRHLGIVFLTLGVVLGLFISGQYLDWWLIFPYLIVGIALVIKEQNVGIGF